MAWQARRSAAYVPDPVYDSTAKRWRGYQRLINWGRGVLCRLLAVGHGRSLYHFVLDLEGKFNFYLEGPDRARRAIAALLPEAPLYAKLALSRCQRSHVHGLAMLTDGDVQQLQATRAVTSCRLIETDKDMDDIGLYFSRPNDENACRSRPKELASYSLEALTEQTREAAERWLEAREACSTARLPRRSWTRNLPYLKPDPTPPRLTAPANSSQRRVVPVRPPPRTMCWLIGRGGLRALPFRAALARIVAVVSARQLRPSCYRVPAWLLRAAGPRGPPCALECVVHHRDLHSKCSQGCPLPHYPTPIRSHRRLSPRPIPSVLHSVDRHSPQPGPSQLTGQCRFYRLSVAVTGADTRSWLR